MTHPLPLTLFAPTEGKDWGSSVVEPLPNMHKALSSVPSRKKVKGGNSNISMKTLGKSYMVF